MPAKPVGSGNANRGAGYVNGGMKLALTLQAQEAYSFVLDDRVLAEARIGRIESIGNPGLMVDKVQGCFHFAVFRRE